MQSLPWTESRTRLPSKEFNRYVQKANGVYRPFSCLCRHSLLQLLNVVCDDLQECPQPEAFADDMEQLFKVEAQIEGPEGIDVDKVGFRVLHYGLGCCIMVPDPNTSPLLVLPKEFYVVPTKSIKFHVVPTEHFWKLHGLANPAWLQSMPPAALGTMV